MLWRLTDDARHRPKSLRFPARDDQLQDGKKCRTRDLSKPFN